MTINNNSKSDSISQTPPTETTQTPAAQTALTETTQTTAAQTAPTYAMPHYLRRPSTYFNVILFH